MVRRNKSLIPSTWTLPSIFEDFWSEDFDFSFFRDLRPSGQPRFDVDETDTHFLIRGELPGINRNNLKITVEDGCLIVDIKEVKEENEKKDLWAFSQRSLTDFKKAYKLPHNVESDEIDAEMKDGILKIKIPKKEEKKEEKKRSVLVK